MAELKTKKPIRVALADDHPAILQNTEHLIRLRKDMQFVGATQAVTEVVALVAKAHPDVLVLDISYHGSEIKGQTLIPEIIQKHPKTNVVVYTQYDQDTSVTECYKAGAKAFIAKHNPEYLIEAITRAANGEVYFTPEIAQRIALQKMTGTKSPLEALSPREREVFKMVAEGRTNPEIAAKLGITTRAAANLILVVKEKTGAERRFDIAKLAQRYGIV